MPSKTLDGVSRAPRSVQPQRGRGKRAYIVTGAVVVAAVIVAVLALRGGTDKSKLTANKIPSTTLGGEVSANAGASQAAAGSGAGQSQGGANGATVRNAPPYKTPAMPVDISVSNTSGLKDGDTVKIHVAAHKGSAVYLFEAFLCQSGVTYQLDADIRPTFSGNCVPPPRPLSPASQSYLKAPATPPYASADGDFRVGVGSTTYAVQSGGTSTVTCGHANPCSIVLKIQYPNGFGFDTIPLSYQ